MSLALQIILSALGGYLIGAIPVGYLVARANGINIFEHGSKNPGATNVKRVVGKRAGNTVFALDALKGALAAKWFVLFALAKVVDFEATNIPATAIAGLGGAMLGHSFSLFTKFKGGKGVATAAGGLIVLLPIPTAIALTVWALVFLSTKYVSLASIIAALTLVAGSWIFPAETQHDILRAPLAYAILTSFMGALVVIRHIPNIKRLLNGTEHKFGTPKT